MEPREIEKLRRENETTNGRILDNLNILHDPQDGSATFIPISTLEDWYVRVVRLDLDQYAYQALRPHADDTPWQMGDRKQVLDFIFEESLAYIQEATQK